MIFHRRMGLLPVFITIVLLSIWSTSVGITMSLIDFSFSDPSSVTTSASMWWSPPTTMTINNNNKTITTSSVQKMFDLISVKTFSGNDYDRHPIIDDATTETNDAVVFDGILPRTTTNVVTISQEKKKGGVVPNTQHGGRVEEYKYSNNDFHSLADPTTSSSQSWTASTTSLKDSSSPTTLFQLPTNSPPWAVFYNIYIPPLGNNSSTWIEGLLGRPLNNEDETIQFQAAIHNAFRKKKNNGKMMNGDQALEKSHQDYAYTIIKEQLRQVGESYAARGIPNTTLTVYYNTIGAPIKNTTWMMDEVCTPLGMSCIHLQHYDEAYEEVTLQHVYDFCKQHPKTHSAIYIHSKGSYHRNLGKNDWFRRHLTKAVTSQDCITSTASTTTTPPPSMMTPRKDGNSNHSTQRQCHVCGLLASGIPWIHLAGNMFVGRCEYIQRLLPLKEYGTKLGSLAQKIKQYENEKRVTATMFPPILKENHLGIGRYAWEHWIGSHPTVELCDLAANKRRSNIGYWKSSSVNWEADTSWDNFPSRDLPLRGNNRRDILLSLREFFLLAGNMIRWIEMYNNTIPPENSWIWTYFPLGQTWREAHSKYGVDTVEVLLN